MLAAPLTDATRGMIDAAALAAMRPTARLINVGRGQLVVENALVEALPRPASPAPRWTCSPTSRSRPTRRCGTLPGRDRLAAHVRRRRSAGATELVELFADNLARYRDGRAAAQRGRQAPWVRHRRNLMSGATGAVGGGTIGIRRVGRT